MNTSYERDFDVIVFHVKNDKKIFIKDDIESILFLSKILTSIEFKYWSIELKTIDLMWLIKRIRHIIEVVNVTSQVIIYTNYLIIIDIVKQTKLSFNNTNKLNFRLVKTFTYLSQYWLDVRHKSKKQYIVLDVFFKLFFNVEFVKKTSNSNQSRNILDMIYHVIVIKIFDDFKLRLKKIYRTNKRWVKILKLITSRTNISSIVKNFFANISFSSIATKLQTSISIVDDSFFVLTKSVVLNELWTKFENLRFRHRDDLIYYVDELNDEKKRFCILKSLINKIFALVHDRLNHVDFYKIYDKIVTFFFIRKLFKKFQTYVTHCSQCQLNRIVKHFLYDFLRFVQSSTISFYIVTINFILTLSITIKNEFDVVLTIIYKFIKKILFILEKNIYSTKQ